MKSPSSNFLPDLFHQLNRAGDRPFVTLMRGREPVPTTAASLRTMVAKARATLRSSHPTEGSRIVLIGENSAEWIAADLAILAEGLVTVPLYTRQSPTELRTIIDDCSPSLVIGEDPKVLDKLGELGMQQPYITLGKLFSSTPVFEPPKELTADSLATLVYTSGTSGVAKGVMITHGNISHMLSVTQQALANLMSPEKQLSRFDRLRFWRKSSEHPHPLPLAPKTSENANAAKNNTTYPDASHHRIFHYLPFCFAGSRIVLWTSLCQGSGISLSSDLTQLSQELGGAKPHYVLNVPTLLERMKASVEAGIEKKSPAVRTLYRQGHHLYIKQQTIPLSTRERLVLETCRRVVFAKILRKLGENLRCLICGSAPLDKDTQRWFEMLGLPVYQVYGLTETTAIVSMDVPGEARAGYVGRVIKGCETKRSDAGELMVRGPHIFAGYWKREDESRQAFSDQWFLTGDRAEFDAAGRLRILGRLRDVIVPENGHNIAPEPIEKMLRDRMRGIEHAIVIGHGRPHLTALLSGKAETREIESVLAEINLCLPHYKRIRSYRCVSEPFSPENGLLTANQKLRRKAVSQHFATEIDAMYADTQRQANAGGASFT